MSDVLLTRYVGYQYVIYEKYLDELVLATVFKYERFAEEKLAIEALASRGELIKKYVILKEYYIIT